MLETPSRIWRRIEAGEAQNGEIPSLPSLPHFEDSGAEVGEASSSTSMDGSQPLSLSLSTNTAPIESTPTASSNAITRSTIRPGSATSSNARFASSIRTNGISKSSMITSSVSRGGSPGLGDKSFDVPHISQYDGLEGSQEIGVDSGESLPDVSLPLDHSTNENGEDERGRSLTDALKSLSVTTSPQCDSKHTPVPPRRYDYSVSLRSESKPSPRPNLANVALRRPFPRNRTPSLSRTTPSPSSGASDSTLRSVADDPSLLASISPGYAENDGCSDEHDRHFEPEDSGNDKNLSVIAATYEADDGEDQASLDGPNLGQDKSEREPTFSSEDDPSAHRSSSIPPALTSPAPSITFTPTPAFPSRMTERMSGFHGQSRIPPGVEDNEEDPATPHVRRKSFLLSVINSTTRPRLSFPTPHPHALGHSNPANAYAGATPGPKSSLHFRQARRSSHPLAQAHVFNPITPSAARSSALADGVSPAGSSASFLSTASSHDLTVHARVNASFDPVTGLQGVGRFNATKLNTYLHGLNRRLQEENEVLLERLRIQQDENMRLMIKQGGSGELSGVAEDATAEGWVLEREVLERQVEDLRSAVQAREDEKVQLESQLDDERVQRMKDKDRWKERMTEVEQGVSDIVQELERKLGAAESAIIDCEKEIKEKTMHLDIANEEKRILVDRAENAERIIGSKKESGEELRDAYGKMSQLSSDLQVANVQIEQLRGDLSLAIESKNEAQAISDASTKTSQDLQSKIKDLKLATQSSEARVKELENQNRAFDEELNDLKAYVDKLESHALEAADRIETLEQQLSMVSEDNERLLTERRDRDEKIKRLDEAAFTAEESALRMTEALAECEKKIVTDEEEIAALVAKIGSKDVGKGGPQDLEKPHSSNADIEALESELDQADKEIARLNNLLQQSPARKAIDKAKDARIAMLERDKEELLERVRALKNTASPFATPTRGFHGSAMSPMHKHLLTMRTPRTPGGPLNDLSWLQNVTQAASTSPLLAEISRLQKELDQANESIDDKLDKLEEAGLGVVQLTKLLQDARARITGMEGDIAALRRKDARRLRRMHKIRCAKCHSTMDVSALSRWLDQDDNSAEVSADISQNHMLDKVEVLQTELQAVNRQLERLKDEWDDEKRRLLAENDGLHDTARRLNQEIRDAKKIVLDAERSANRVKSGSQVDLDRAKRTIADLEDELRSERSQLRSIVTQQARAVREKTDISSQLQKAEAELSDVKLQLLSAKQRNSEMELEQRAHAKAGQNSQLLESKLEKNSKLIEQLRGETSLLSDEKASLQRQLSRATQEIEEMGRKNAASQSALEDRRHQLDSYSAQIDELRSKLAAQKNERQGVQHTIDSLESDLRRVRNDAEVFGSDLRLLRTEKERIEAKYRAELESQEQLQMQSQTKIRMLQEELAQQRSSAGKYAQTSEEQLSSAYGESVELLRAQHNKECKGLIVQIRYLKAKFTRESSLRSDLGYQKQYLLILLSKYETSEKRILASISQIGYPAQKPERVKRRSLKVMVLLAIFVVRTKRASAEWQDQRSCRKDIADALTVVRKRRIEGL